MFRDSRDLPVPPPSHLLPSTTLLVLDPSPVAALLAQPGAWRVLVHQRADNGWWGFPGGAQELGESLVRCAIRECLEETGYTIALDRLVCVDSDPLQGACVYYATHRRTVQYTNLTFLAHVVSGTLRCSPESRQVCWVPGDTLPQPFLPTHSWRLMQALAMPTPLPVR